MTTVLISSLSTGIAVTDLSTGGTVEIPFVPLTASSLSFQTGRRASFARADRRNTVDEGIVSYFVLLHQDRVVSALADILSIGASDLYACDSNPLQFTADGNLRVWLPSGSFSSDAASGPCVSLLFGGAASACPANVLTCETFYWTGIGAAANVTFAPPQIIFDAGTVSAFHVMSFSRCSVNVTLPIIAHS